MPSDDGHPALMSPEVPPPKPQTADGRTASWISAPSAKESGERYAGWSPRLRLLCVGPREPSWVSLTLQLDADGCFEPQIRWVTTSHEALTALRDASFDCLVLGLPDAGGSETARFEPVSLVRAIRASGHDDPIVVLATHLDEEPWAELSRHDCDVLVTPNLWESLALVPVIKRAIRRVELARENHHLSVAQQRRLVRDRDEAEHLLKQQWQIISELQQANDRPNECGTRSAECGTPNADLTPSSSADRRSAGDPQGSSDKALSRFGLPPEINEYYHELLRTYVIMGAGSLGSDIARLAELIALAGLSPRESLELHLERVESLVRGLGRRSARHVMARADLLALELVIHLGEWYQRGCRDSNERLKGQNSAHEAPVIEERAPERSAGYPDGYV